jgi:hypothetical protein
MLIVAVVSVAVLGWAVVIWAACVVAKRGDEVLRVDEVPSPVVPPRGVSPVDSAARAVWDGDGARADRLRAERRDGHS